MVIDTHFHADTNSGTYFIYGKADEVALYFTKNYPGKTVGTLTEVSFVVLVEITCACTIDIVFTGYWA